MVQTLGGAAPARRPRRRRRRAASEPGADPPEVPLTRLTVITAEPLGAPRTPRGELERAAGDAEAAEAAVAAGLRAVNAVLRAHRVATHDPYGHEIGREAALVARVGYGTGEGLAEGRWEEAVEIPYPERRRRRAEALRPQERLAAVLAGREPIDVCETLLLRARADLDQGRPREAALQLRAGLEALLAELPGRRRGLTRREDLAALGSAARAPPRRPTRRFAASCRAERADEVAETLGSASASCAAARSWRSEGEGGLPEGRQHGAQLLGHVAVEAHGGLGVVRGRALGDDRDPPAARRG